MNKPNPPNKRNKSNPLYLHSSSSTTTTIDEKNKVKKTPVIDPYQKHLNTILGFSKTSKKPTLQVGGETVSLNIVDGTFSPSKYGRSIFNNLNSRSNDRPNQLYYNNNRSNKNNNNHSQDTNLISISESAQKYSKLLNQQSLKEEDEEILSLTPTPPHNLSKTVFKSFNTTPSRQQQTNLHSNYDIFEDIGGGLGDNIDNQYFKQKFNDQHIDNDNNNNNQIDNENYNNDDQFNSNLNNVNNYKQPEPYKRILVPKAQPNQQQQQTENDKHDDNGARVSSQSNSELEKLSFPFNSSPCKSFQQFESPIVRINEMEEQEGDEDEGSNVRIIEDSYNEYGKQSSIKPSIRSSTTPSSSSSNNYSPIMIKNFFTPSLQPLQQVDSPRIINYQLVNNPHIDISQVINDTQLKVLSLPENNKEDQQENDEDQDQAEEDNNDDDRCPPYPSPTPPPSCGQ